MLQLKNKNDRDKAFNDEFEQVTPGSTYGGYKKKGEVVQPVPKNSHEQRRSHQLKKQVSSQMKYYLKETTGDQPTEIQMDVIDGNLFIVGNTNDEGKQIHKAFGIGSILDKIKTERSYKGMEQVDKDRSKKYSGKLTEASKNTGKYSDFFDSSKEISEDLAESDDLFSILKNPEEITTLDRKSGKVSTSLKKLKKPKGNVVIVTGKGSLKEGKKRARSENMHAEQDLIGIREELDPKDNYESWEGPSGSFRPCRGCGHQKEQHGYTKERKGLAWKTKSYDLMSPDETSYTYNTGHKLNESYYDTLASDSDSDVEERKKRKKLKTDPSKKISTSV